MKLIPLTQGHVALVDDQDYEDLMRYKWFADIRGCGIYIKRHRPIIDGKNGNIYMHRQIMGVSDSKMIVDHINGNQLDNRRENLRLCTHSQNSMNCKATKGRRIPFKGVFVRPSGRFGARIMFERRQITIGTFDTQEEAACAYDQKAKELFGEFANPNF